MVEYRFDVFFRIFAHAAGYASQFIVVWIIIDRFESLAGWKSYEVMFLMGFNLLSYAMAGSFMFNFSRLLPARIQSGELDEIFIKPLNPFLYLIFKDFAGYFGHFILSITIIVISIIKLGIKLSIIKIIFFVITLLGAMLIQMAAFVFTSVPAFWLVKNNSLMDVFLWQLKSFINYPLSIYNKTVQILFTLIVPFGFINFYPSQYFLSKNDFLMFHPVLQYLTPVIGVVLIISAYRFWLFGLNHYKSTGS